MSNDPKDGTQQIEMLPPELPGGQLYPEHRGVGQQLVLARAVSAAVRVPAKIAAPTAVILPTVAIKPRRDERAANASSIRSSMFDMVSDLPFSIGVQRHL